MLPKSKEAMLVGSNIRLVLQWTNGYVNFSEMQKIGIGKKLELRNGERGTSSGRQRNAKTGSDSRQKNQKDVKLNIERFADDAAESLVEDSGKLFDDLEKSALKTSTDDTTDTASSLSTQSATSEPDAYSKSGSTEQEPARDSMTAQAGKQQQKRFDLQKRGTSSQSSAKPSDFRGQLKKTGVNLRNLEKKGKPEKIWFPYAIEKDWLEYHWSVCWKKEGYGSGEFPICFAFARCFRFWNAKW